MANHSQVTVSNTGMGAWLKSATHQITSRHISILLGQQSKELKQYYFLINISDTDQNVKVNIYNI
jgi:hypothetical protein